MPKFVSKPSTSFQRWLTVGFATTVAVTAIIAIVATVLLHDVIQNQDLVIYDYGQHLILTERLRFLAEKEISTFRGFFLHAGDESFLQGLAERQKQFSETIQQLRKTASTEELNNLEALVKLDKEYETANQALVEKVHSGEQINNLVVDIAAQVRPFREQFESELAKLTDIETHQLALAKAKSIHMAHENFILIALITSIALALAGILAFVFSRTLNQLYQSALRATHLREEMLGIVAHDLKNPIASIGVISSLMQRVIDSKGDAARLTPTLDRLDRVTQQMYRLIEDLLVVDKIESGLFSLNLKPEILKTIATDVVDSLQPLALEKQIHLKLHLDSDLGEVACDRDRLHQVFSNLIGNAIKFTPAGGTVDFRIEKWGTEIHFEITDTGPGISSSQIPRLFERHWQAKETAQKGNGLGLYIAQNIVRAHGSEISVSSELGKGASFAFSLAVKPTLAL